LLKLSGAPEAIRTPEFCRPESFRWFARNFRNCEIRYLRCLACYPPNRFAGFAQPAMCLLARPSGNESRTPLPHLIGQIAGLKPGKTVWDRLLPDFGARPRRRFEIKHVERAGRVCGCTGADPRDGEQEEQYP
jgi:hypothetical protein